MCDVVVQRINVVTVAKRRLDKFCDRDKHNDRDDDTATKRIFNMRQRGYTQRQRIMINRITVVIG